MIEKLFSLTMIVNCIISQWQNASPNSIKNSHVLLSFHKLSDSAPVFQKVHSLLYHEPYTDYRVSSFHSKVLFNFHHQVDQLQFHKISLSDLTAILPYTFFFGPSKELISISKSICLLLFIPSDSRVGQMRQL